MAGLSDVHARWLEQRGIEIELAVRYGVESRGIWMAFPYMECETQRYAKLRTIGKNFLKILSFPANISNRQEEAL